MVGLAGIETKGYCTAPGEKAGKQTGGREHGNSDVKNTWVTQEEIIHSIQSVSLRVSVHKDTSVGIKEII